jgi:nucleoside-diphosphate-sugar epimerase
MRVMVTGALGYVGNVLCEALEREKIDFLKVDISLYHEISKSHIIRNYGDLESIELDGVDAVVHLGAISNDPMGNKYSALTEKVNYHGSCKLLEMVKSKRGVKKFVFASSCSNYGSVADGSKVNENSALSPQTAYANSKVNFEKYMSINADNSDNELIAFRFATACGPSQAMRTDLVLNNFVDSALRKGEIILNSSGSANRPLIDVEDMARFIIWGLRKPFRNGFEIYNAGFNENNINIRKLAEMVQAELKVKKLTFPDELINDNRSYAVSFDKISVASGYVSPIHTIQQSIHRLVDFYNFHGGWLAKTDPMLKADAFIRLAALPAVLHRLN